MKKIGFNLVLLILAVTAKAQYSGGVGDGYAATLLKNKLPEGKSFSRSISENGEYFFSDTDFVFTDADGYFKAVKIISLETNGDLEYRNVNVILNDTVTDFSLLHFKPLYNEYGWPYASFQFKLMDNENGLSSASYTCTFYVIHNPIGHSLITSVNEDDTLNIPAEYFTATYGSGRSFQSLILKEIPSRSKLYYQQELAQINVPYSDLSAFKYIAPPDSNGLLFDKFRYELVDNQGLTSDSVYTLQFNVNAVNDEPTGQNTEITALEDVSFSFSTSIFSFADVDEGNTLAGIIITNSTAKGTFKYANSIVSDNDTIRSLNNLSYQAKANESGNYYDEFYFKVIDNTNIGSIFTYVCRIHVAALNDAPTSADTSIIINEDEIYTFQSNNFVFNDIDSDVAAAISIQSLPAKGSLKYNNSLFSLPMTISNIQLLSYSPPANQFGENFAEFRFQMLDDSSATSAVHTLSIHINETNDLPIAQNFTKYLKEDIPYYFNKTDLKYADPESDSLFGFIFLNQPAKGKLMSKNSSIITNQVYSTADSVYFVSATNDYGAYYANVQLKVVDAKNGISQNSYTAEFHVDAAPDFPTSENSHLAFFEDSLQSFKTLTIPFYDADGQKLAGLQFDSLPKNGKIFYESKEIVTGTLYSDLSLLQYKPNKDLNGVGADSVFARVSDNTPLLSAQSYLYYIDLAPVNDPPHNINLTQNHIPESMPLGSIIGYLSAEDIDSETFSFELAESEDLSDIDNNSFTIENDALKTAISLDYENQYLYFVRIAAIDEQLAEFSMGFMIYVDNETENSIYQSVSAIKFYPNPAKEYVQFELGTNSTVNYRIINLKGNLILEGSLENADKIFLTNLPNGFYILQLESLNGYYQYKFIKE